MDNADPLPEPQFLIDETIEVKDKGHKVIDWKLRNKLHPINGDPEKYWSSRTWDTELSPNLGGNFVLGHIFLLTINPGSIRRAKECSECCL